MLIIGLKCCWYVYYVNYVRSMNVAKVYSYYRNFDIPFPYSLPEYYNLLDNSQSYMSFAIFLYI